MFFPTMPVYTPTGINSFTDLTQLYNGVKLVGESTRPLTGRKKILIPRQEVTAESLPNILEQVMPIHNINYHEISYLFRFLRGDQPILNRVKEIRPEICNKLVANIAFEITNFKDGFDMADPWPYIEKGKTLNAPGQSEAAVLLNKYSERDKKPNKDKRLLHDVHVAGSGYRAIFPVGDPQKPFMTDVLKPSTTFVVYDTAIGNEPWLCGYGTVNVIGEWIFYIYDENTDAIVNLTPQSTNFIFNSSWDIEVKLLQKPMRGFLPIIEYIYNDERLGCFEVVHELLNSINEALSDNIDGLDQFIQHLLWLNDTKINDEQYDQLRQKGLIQTKSTGNNKPSVAIIGESIDYNGVASLINNIYQHILRITGTPDRNSAASNNTGEASKVGQGWEDAKGNRKSTFAWYKQSEERLLESMFKIFDTRVQIEPVLRSLTLDNIDLSPNFSSSENLQSKIQAFSEAMKSGMDPHDVFLGFGLTADAEQAYQNALNNGYISYALGVPQEYIVKGTGLPTLTASENSSDNQVEDETSNENTDDESEEDE